MGLLSVASYVGVIYLIVNFIVGIIAAFWVFIDGSKRERLAFNIPPLLWAIIVLVSPALGILIYWIIHNSNLRPKEAVQATSSTEK